jgi:hypothetical protein
VHYFGHYTIFLSEQVCKFVEGTFLSLELPVAAPYSQQSVLNIPTHYAPDHLIPLKIHTGFVPNYMFHFENCLE